MTQTNVAGSAGYGKFSIDASGTWTYTAEQRRTTSSSPATTYTDSIDGRSGRRHDARSVTVNILGTNDAAVITGVDTRNLTETNAALTHRRHADRQRRRQLRRPL